MQSVIHLNEWLNERMTGCLSDCRNDSMVFWYCGSPQWQWTFSSWPSSNKCPAQVVRSLCHTNAAHVHVLLNSMRILLALCSFSARRDSSSILRILIVPHRWWSFLHLQDFIFLFVIVIVTCSLNIKVKEISGDEWQKMAKEKDWKQIQIKSFAETAKKWGNEWGKSTRNGELLNA